MSYQFDIEHRFPRTTGPRSKSVIYADPPWMEAGGGGRGAQNHYPLMMTEDIAHLPVIQLAAPDAHLWMWVTDNFLPDGLYVGKSWGFRYVCSFIWRKPSVGTGQYKRTRHEYLILFSRGRASVPEKAWPDSFIDAPRLRHSQKPAVAYDIIDHVSARRFGGRLELFARSGREGWEALGNEAPGVGGSDITDQLWHLIDGRPARPALNLGGTACHG